MKAGREIISLVAERQDLERFRKKNWEGTFEEYLDMVRANPRLTRNAFERVYDMIQSYGTETYEENRERHIRYRFFSDPDDGGRDAVFGLDASLNLLANAFKSAAQGYGIEKRVLLLHGPVGSSKSTIARLLKKGLERYSAGDDGAMYTLGWSVEGNVQWCPMNEEPLHLVPERFREEVATSLNGEQVEGAFRVRIHGELCPFCRYVYTDLRKHYGGDWTRVVQDVRVKRLILSEKDRIGIGTFQPKDEKNQDSTELTGDINYRKIAEYGSDSDPRAFNFDGEFNVANRGLIEFVEVLKLDVAFLYDLLGASQEHKVKPKKFAQTDIDEVILGHTNEPEYRRLQNNEFMEALRDRTVKIDVPYVTRLSDEIKIYEKDYNRQTVKGKHIAPHTIEMAAMWAILTRLEEPKNAGLSLLQKLKLYNGKSLPGFTEDNIKELREQAVNEGMHGISPRYVQDKISNALVAHPEATSINPFMVMNELEVGAEAPHADYQRRAAGQVPRAAGGRQGGVREHRQERSPASHRRRRRRAQAALRQLHRQRQSLHPAGEGQEPVHRPVPGAGRAADAVDRAEDRHSGQPQGRFPPRDHELHRSPVDRRPDLRLQDQRTALQGARAQAVRRPEGLDQADQPGVESDRRRDAGQDRRGQVAADPRLRLRRRKRDRRAELRRQHLCPGRCEALGGGAGDLGVWGRRGGREEEERRRAERACNLLGMSLPDARNPRQAFAAAGRSTRSS